MKKYEGTMKNYVGNKENPENQILYKPSSPVDITRAMGLWKFLSPLPLDDVTFGD